VTALGRTAGPVCRHRVAGCRNEEECGEDQRRGEADSGAASAWHVQGNLRRRPDQ